MNVENIIKENLNISGKSKRQLGVALYDFVLKEQMQYINENSEEKFRRQNKSPIKRKRGKDNYEKEDEPTFMITTAAAVREVCVVKGDRARERAEAEDKGKREKRHSAANRANKKININDEGEIGGEEDDPVSPSSGKRGRGSGSGSDSNKVGSKRSRAIAKSRRG